MKLDSLSSFFIQTTPGFEQLAINELKLKWSALDSPISALDTIQVDKGGFQIEMPLQDGLKLNLILKIPNRILLRLESFKCRDFPKLYNKIAKFPWRYYLRGTAPKVSATAHKSRLIHTTKLEETAIRGIEKYFEAQPPKKSLTENPSPMPPTLFIRLNNDDLTLSLDTSGERLHKRKLREISGIAPLRESIAAALLLHTWANNDQSAFADLKLVDPMCGTGTFLFEAANFFEISERDYSFYHFPFFEGKVKFNIKYDNTPFQINNFIGKDTDAQVIDHNLKVSNRFNFNQSMLFIQEDLFSKGNLNEENLWVITNPPYGKRAKLKTEIQDYFKAIIKKYSPNLIGIILPSFEPYYKSKEYSLQERLEFSNGGLDVRFELWKKIQL